MADEYDDYVDVPPMRRRRAERRYAADDDEDDREGDRYMRNQRPRSRARMLRKSRVRDDLELPRAERQDDGPPAAKVPRWPAGNRPEDMRPEPPSQEPPLKQEPPLPQEQSLQPEQPLQQEIPPPQPIVSAPHPLPHPALEHQVPPPMPPLNLGDGQGGLPSPDVFNVPPPAVPMEGPPQHPMAPMDESDSPQSGFEED